MTRKKTILFTAEGTYPYVMGGVSTWSDQLITGLSEYDFKVLTVVGPHPVKPAIELPKNVVGVTPAHFWRPRQNVKRAGREQTVRFSMLFPNLVSFAHEDTESFGNALIMMARLGNDYNLWPLFEGRNVWEIIRATLADLLGKAPRLGEVTMTVNWLKSTLAPLLFIPPEADIVHAVTNGLCAVPSYVAAYTYGVPLLLTEHGVYLRERYLGFKGENEPYSLKLFRSRFYETLAKLMYTQSHCVTSVSHFNKYWQLKLGAIEDNTRVIPNGIDPDAFTVSSVKHQSEPTIVWIGRVDPLKDLETLVRAFAVVRDAIPNARLRMFGPIPEGNQDYFNRIESLIGQFDLHGNAVFEGPIRPATKAYHAADVVVLSSISEGFPYTVVEAMMCGRPVVSTRAGGTGDAIGDVGFMVPPRNPDALGEALIKVLRDPQMRETLGKRSRQRCLDHFTLDQMCENYANLYQEFSSSRNNYSEQGEMVFS